MRPRDPNPYSRSRPEESLWLALMELAQAFVIFLLALLGSLFPAAVERRFDDAVVLPLTRRWFPAEWSEPLR